MNAITGLVLAGGQGQRMGGADKGLQLFHGRPLVAHVLDRIGQQVDRLVISANRNKEAYAVFGHPVAADAMAGYAGPLAGLQAGLRVCRTPLLAMVPCDAPRLPLDLVSRLKTALDDRSAMAALARTADGLQPAFLLCRRDALAALESYLAGGGRGISAWLATLDAAIADFPDDANAFANINTLEELLAASGLE